MLYQNHTTDIPPYSGYFEAHITVNPLNEEQSRLFGIVAKNLNVKAIQIQLSRGDMMVQPMTCSRHQGDFQAVYQEVLNISQELKQLGFEVNRLKIEAHPDNIGVPKNNEEAKNHSSQNYFEHHLKVLLNRNSDLEELTNMCEQYQAHLSSNAFKIMNDGQYENFITTRHYFLGKNEAENRFNEFIEYIKKLNIPILKHFMEYCIFDTNIELDKNWLTQNTTCQNCNLICEKNA